MDQDYKINLNYVATLNGWLNYLLMHRLLLVISEDSGIDDDDDVDEDFLVDEENEIIEPDVDVHLFGINMDLPFENNGVTNLVLDDVLEGEDMDVINADGFNSDLGNDEEKITGREEAKDRVYLYYIESRTNLKLYKNDGFRIRARCDGKVPIFTMSQGTGPTGENHRMEAGPNGLSGPTTRTKKGRIHLFEQVRVNPDILVKAVQDQLQHELEVQMSMSKTFRAKAKAGKEIRGDHVLQYSMVRDYVVELQSTNPNTKVKITVERNTDPSLPTRGPFPGQVLVAVELDSNNGIYPLAYTLVEVESIIPSIKTVYPSAEHIYCLRHIHENMKQRWCGQANKDLLWRAASATNVRDFEKYMLELKTMNPKAHEHNKATCKGQGRKATTGGNNAEANDSASRQARETEPAVGHDGSGGSGVGAVIGLSAAAGEGGASGPGGAGVASQGSSHSRWTKRRYNRKNLLHKKRTLYSTIALSTCLLCSQVPVSETRNADGIEIGDGVPTQSSAAGGASEWSFL
ncbi:hypothetical protein Tco_1505748 [Tanacetum coccineum]